MLKKIFGVIFLMAGIAGLVIGVYLFISAILNFNGFGEGTGMEVFKPILSKIFPAIFIAGAGSVIIPIGIRMIKYREIENGINQISKNLNTVQNDSQQQKTAENIKNAIGKFEKIFGVSIQEKVCPYCGTKMEPKAKKCDSCGAKL